MNLEALNILTADVEDKINIRLKIFCRGKMRNCFNNSVIHGKSIFNKLLTVPGDGAALYPYSVTAKSVYFIKTFADNIHGISSV